MELSPEERRTIYEEEKARLEAEENLEREKQGAEGVSTTNLQPNVAGLLCYVGIWITGIIFLLIEQKNRFVRFHAIQSIVVFGALGIGSAILNQIPLVGWFFAVIIGVSTFILWIVLMVKAYQGELYKVPLAGALAEKMSALSYGKDTEIGKKEEHPEPTIPSEHPSPARPVTSGKETGDKVDDYFKNTRNGRITSSSLAIAWSFVLLVFFNFFNEYVAYYQYELSEWVKYPILTEDFNSWLPILTITLTFFIAGHAILIISDKYILRETALIVLNLFGLAVVLTLLSIFPFDFNDIPNTTMADIAPIITTVALIGIAVGLGIGTLVSFIKLIANVVRRTTNY